jgi:hypothetical protein
MTESLPQASSATATVVVYAEDCVLSGTLDIGGARLSDRLNDRIDHVLTDVIVTSLADGHRLELPTLTVAGDEILAVDTAGPRGDPAKRRRTRQHPIAVKAGPYIVRGYFHALPGADPVASFARRPAFVPLTDAWLEFSLGDQPIRAQAGTLLVNRDATDWLQPVEDDEVALPAIPVATAGGPMVKDFTYQVLVSEVGKEKAVAATDSGHSPG